MHDATKRIIVTVHPKWKVLLNTPFMDSLLMDELDRVVTKVVTESAQLCPNSADKVLRCLQQDPDKIKVVVIGQDPYPQPDIATGLAFAVNEGTKYPPSLNIILRELEKEYPDCVEAPFDSTLESWEKQGVLLLNSALSCDVYKPGSHTQYWVNFMSGLMQILNQFKVTRESMESLIFVFLGSQAKLFQTEIGDYHYKIYRYHPAAETHGSNKFVGFFEEVNKILESNKQDKIQWIHQ